MKFKYIALVTDDFDPWGWEEEHILKSTTEEEALAEIKDILERFNNRGAQTFSRKLEAVIKDPDAKPIHCNWEKKNLISNKDGSDTWHCTHCGKLARRPFCGMRLIPKGKLKVGCVAEF